MKRLLFVVILISLLSNIYGGKNKFVKPDYKVIKKEIQDENSQFYYPSLFERYQDSDTTLTLQDYRMLYYGFLFHDSYTPYGHSDYVDSLNAIFNKEIITIEDYKEIIRFEKLILDEFPFSLRDIYTLSNVYYQIGDTVSTIKLDYKLNMLVETILSTGDGKKEKTAWHVISVSHEYDILSYFGFQFGGSQSLTQKGCDYLEVADNDYNIKGFYFDVNMILSKEAELFK